MVESCICHGAAVFRSLSAGLDRVELVVANRIPVHPPEVTLLRNVVKTNPHGSGVAAVVSKNENFMRNQVRIQDFCKVVPERDFADVAHSELRRRYKFGPEIGGGSHPSDPHLTLKVVINLADISSARPI